jgi:uronate dehydrogenase
MAVQRVFDGELVKIEFDAYVLELAGLGILERDPDETPGLAEMEMNLLLGNVRELAAVLVRDATDQQRSLLTAAMIPRVPRGLTRGTPRVTLEARSTETCMSGFQRILVTGAAGEIGSTLRRGLSGAYTLLRLSDVRAMPAAQSGEETVQTDLTDASSVDALMHGIDCVVHLGGVPREAPWGAILHNNIEGTYNVFEAARAHGVKRIVFASSNHTIGYYRVGRRVGVDEPVRPDSRYGVSKVFGEALGRLYADKHGLEVACLRIGSFRKEPGDFRQLATWISPRDTVQLVRRCIDAPAFHFLVLYGVSANTRSRWDNPHAAFVGYAPQDDAEAYADRFAAPRLDGADPVAEFHGGPFCGLEFDGDIGHVD